MADSVPELVRARIEESVDTKRRLADDEHVQFAVDAAELLIGVFRAGGKVILCGNGGSAADATHLAAELVGRYLVDRAPLAALSLTDNASSLTAIGNDYSYGETFVRQVRGLGREGDALIALSTSGRSENVLAAMDAAREMGMRVVGMTGSAGGQLAERADICLRVPSDQTPRIQEGYMLVAHTVCELVERALVADA